MRTIGDQYRPGFGCRLHARGSIHRITEDVYFHRERGDIRFDRNFLCFRFTLTMHDDLARIRNVTMSEYLVKTL